MQDTMFGIMIGLTTKGFGVLNGNIQKLSKMAEQAKKTGANIEGLNKKIEKIKSINVGIQTNKDKISTQISNIGYSLAKLTSFAVPVKIAIDQEEAMVDLKKYVDFASKEEFKAMGEDFRKLSGELGLGFNELTAIGASGGQQGLKSDQILDYTKLVSKMGVAFDMSGKDAGEFAAYTMNNFKLSISELEKLGNQINFLDDKMSMVNGRDIFNTLSRTAGSAKILGLGAANASALSASLLSAGKAPEVVSTALNSLYNSLANIDGQKDSYHEALKKMGMDAQYLKVIMQKNANEGIEFFLKSLAKIDDKEKMGVLTDLFGKEFADDMGTLVSNIDIYENALKNIKADSKGSLDEAMALKLSTTRSSIQRFQSSLTNLGAKVGEAFMPVFNFLLNIGAKVVNFTSYLVNEFPRITNVLLGVVGGFLALGVIVPVFKILGAGALIFGGTIAKAWHGVSFLASWVKILSLHMLKGSFVSSLYSKASLGLSSTMKFVKNAFIGASIGAKIFRLALLATGIGALVVLAGAIITNWDKVKEWFSSFSSWLKSIFEPVISWFSQKFGGLFDWIGEKLSWIVDSFKNVAGFLGFGDESDNTQGHPASGALVGRGASDNTHKTGSSWYNPSSWFGADEPTISPAPALTAGLASGGTININLNGGFSIATSNGKFDLSEFETAIVSSVKRALARDERNIQNRKVSE